MSSTARHREGLASYISSPSDQVLHFSNREGIKGSQQQKQKHFPCHPFLFLGCIFCLHKKDNPATRTVPNFLFLPQKALNNFLCYPKYCPMGGEVYTLLNDHAFKCQFYLTECSERRQYVHPNIPLNGSSCGE